MTFGVDVKTLAPVVVRELPKPSQLPAVISGPQPLAELYRRMDALEKQLSTASSTAIAKVGTDAPTIARTKQIGDWVVSGAIAAAALAGAATAFFAVELTWVGAAFTGAASALGTTLAGKGSWFLITNRMASRAAISPPAQDDLKLLRAVAAVDVSPVEAAALGRSAASWAGTLRTRQVRGFEAQEILEEIRARGGKASSDEDSQAKRFEALRSVIVAYQAANQVDHKSLAKLRHAFGSLTDDEKQQLAPIVLEQMFHEEAPTRDGWDFHDAYAMHARLWQIARGEPDPEAPVSLPTAADTIANEAAATEQAVAEQSAVPVVAQSAVATMDDAIRDFEAALVPTLSRSRSVTAESIASAIAIANGAAATPVATVGIGARAKRFIEQLDQRQLFGHEARLQLRELVERGEQLGPGLRDQIARIDAYRAAVDQSPPTKLVAAGVDKILNAILGLLPCDQRPAAQRAYDRYFTNGVANTKLGSETIGYDDAQRFLMGLRKYIKD